MSEPVLPRYGCGALSDVMGSVAAALGVPGSSDLLGLAGGRAYVVMLIDGLGWELLERFRSHAPYLAGLMDVTLTVGTPATTATSLTSLGTGLPPGEHGIVGYRFWLPETAQIVCPLVWDSDADPRRVQPTPTVLERAVAAGVPTTVVAPARFENSGLTLAALRGGEFVPVTDEEDETERAGHIRAAVAAGTQLLYCYERRLDHAGHTRGMAADEFRATLRAIDAAAEELRATLPDDVRLVFTGDHGMVDVPRDRRIGIEDVPTLGKGVARIGGEGRFRHLYCEDADAVAARWQDYLGDRAWVRTRAQAAAAGWFGSLPEHHAARVGDVVAAMRDDWAVMTYELPREWNLIGMHASLTAGEMLVPLLVD